MAENEDIPYSTPDFAMDDTGDSASDEEKKLSPRNALVKELRKYLKEAMVDHNSFDILNIPQNATPEEKIAVFDEMFNHKAIVHHLRQMGQIINNHVKEN